MPWPQSTDEPKYVVLEGSRPQPDEQREHVSSRTRQSLAVLSGFALVTLATFFVLVMQADHVRPPPNACTNPSIRREWRALRAEEREDFVQAIKCISKTPSTWQMNRTIYDDIAILHGGVGNLCHRSACFLPWHRHVLAVIESKLKRHCGFRGLLPYWDWSLDWMDLARSSIWDNSTGFGGDGDSLGVETVGNGRCVIDGPFADLRPIIYNHTFAEHCLSRGFSDGKITGRLPGDQFSPENIGEILRQSDYSSFLRRVERDLHNTLHNSINGDFKAMTAANDPLFFLHHVNLDRLWWVWQRQSPSDRYQQYLGQHMYNSTGAARLDDALLFDGFTKDVSVSQVMETTKGLHCYAY